MLGIPKLMHTNSMDKIAYICNTDLISLFKTSDHGCSQAKLIYIGLDRDSRWARPRLPTPKLKKISTKRTVKTKSSMERVDEVSPTLKGVNDEDFCDKIQQKIPYAELLYEIS